MTKILEGKNIVLGVCGGIAAYKSIELLRLMVKQGAKVRVIMTRSAAEFVGPMTFKTLSGQPVCLDLFDQFEDAAIRHIEWAEEADAVVIAPATANMIGKLAGGMADDALSTFMMAVTAPRLICPSMNTHMYENRAVQRNLDLLEGDGFSIVEPGSGELACGTTGAGRLPAPEYILDRLIKRLTPNDMVGKRILLTAGPTAEPIDPVRYISNHSSGKMGFALARAAEYRGAEVVLVAGPTALAEPAGVRVVKVKTAAEMAAAVFEEMENAHVVIKVAAVADYRSKDQAPHKIKKKDEDLSLTLVKNPDILMELGRRKKGQFLVGFAAETRELAENAGKKLAAKNLDIIVGNIVGDPASGFGADNNTVTLFYRDGTREPFVSMEKEAVAHIILDRVLDRMAG